MAYSPMHKGLLTGKYTGDEKFHDFRQHHEDFEAERFKHLAVQVKSLGPMAERYGLTIYQLVLAATLMHPAVHVAVCGIKTPEQIAEAVGALGKTISREDYFAVRKAVLGSQAPKVLDAKAAQK